MLSIDVASGHPVCGVLLGYITHFVVYYKITKPHNDILASDVGLLSVASSVRQRSIVVIVHYYVHFHPLRSLILQLVAHFRMLFVHRTKNTYRQWEWKLEFHWHAFLSHFVNEIIRYISTIHQSEWNKIFLGREEVIPFHIHITHATK